MTVGGVRGARGRKTIDILHSWLSRGTKILYREGIFLTSIWAEGINKNVLVAGYHYSVFECLGAQSVSASGGALKRCPSRVNYRQTLDPTAAAVVARRSRHSQTAQTSFLHFIPPLQTRTVAVGAGLRLPPLGS